MRDRRVLFVTIEKQDDGAWLAVLWGLGATKLASGAGFSAQEAMQVAGARLAGPMARRG